MTEQVKGIPFFGIQKVKRLALSIRKILETKRLMKSEAAKMVKPVAPESLKIAGAELKNIDQSRQSHQKTTSYFVEARSWADDIYTAAIISRNRYKFAFYLSIGLAVLLTIAIDSLVPLQHMEPLLVNHYQDGRVSVQPIKQPYAPTNPAQVESEIVRYVINRESFDPTSYDTQYSLVNLLSSNFVAKAYRHTQSSARASSPINRLGTHGFRTVHVDSVIFLDTELNNNDKANTKHHHNLAQVNFSITDHDRNSALQKSKAFTALVSWQYRGMPSDPGDQWRNWDGFTVTRFTKQQRNV